MNTGDFSASHPTGSHLQLITLQPVERDFKRGVMRRNKVKTFSFYLLIVSPDIVLIGTWIRVLAAA
jgi:hypothetical protein